MCWGQGTVEREWQRVYSWVGSKQYRDYRQNEPLVDGNCRSVIVRVAVLLWFHPERILAEPHPSIILCLKRMAVF